jgi:RNA polymerase primary sigma factor
MPAVKVGEIELWAQKKASLDAPVGSDGESHLSDFIKSDDDSSDTPAAVSKIFDKERVSHLLDSVSHREKTVLNLRFGITDGKAHTLAGVADILGVSRERVRQIEKEALKKLQKYAQEEQEKKLEG